MAGDFLPALAMTVVQMGYAGMNIVSKLAMDSGMDPFVHVTYRQLVATISLAPLAFFLERKTWHKLTYSILFQIFLCSVFGATVNQIMYFVGLKNSTPTIASALTNLIPAFTFALAVPFGLEKVGLRSKAGQAKVLGTIICVGGAILLSLYQGPAAFGVSRIHWKFANHTRDKNASNHTNFFLGPLLVIVCSVSVAVWITIQAEVAKIYNAPYSSSTLTCFMATIECAIVSFCFNHDLLAWSLTPPIRAVASIYAGVVGSALAFCLVAWCVEREGPLYVSIFNPVLLVIVAILSWTLLQEKLYAGTVVGSALIVMGLYMVIWGKKNEKNEEEKEEEQKPTIGADDGVHSEKNAELKATNGVDHGVDFGRQITRDEMGLELFQV